MSTAATSKFAKAPTANTQKSDYELAAEASQRADGKIRSEGTYVATLKEIRRGNNKVSGLKYFAVEAILVNPPEASGHRNGDTVTAQFSQMGQFPSYFYGDMQTVAARLTACPASMQVPANIVEEIFEKNVLSGMPIIIRAELRSKSKAQPDQKIMATSIVRRLTVKECEEYGLNEAAAKLSPGGDWE